MSYEGNMLILSIQEKLRFLEELRKRYGGDIKLRDLQHKIHLDSKEIPIEECRFTGVDGPDGEFTGTIKDIVKDLYVISGKDLTNQKIFNWLIDVFTNGEQWVPYGDYTNGAVRCVPVDRILSVVEVSEYLEELAANSVTW